MIDYEREDFTKNGENDEVVWTRSARLSPGRSRRSLEPGGTFVETDLGFMWHCRPSRS